MKKNFRLFTPKLNESIQNSPRCDLYKHIFSLLNQEKYLCVDISPVLRRAFAKFRCSSHKLKIELGRHFNIARDDRVCHHCLLNHDILLVETEYHCFFYCSLLNAERQTLLFSWYQGRNDIMSIYNLLKSKKLTTIRKVAKYISTFLTLKDENQGN